MSDPRHVLGPLSLDTLYQRIADFIRRYGGTPPAKDERRSLDMLSDFACAGGFDWEMHAHRIDAAHLQPEPRKEVVPNSDSETNDKSAAPLVGADPPWLDEAAKAAHDAAGWHKSEDNWFWKYEEAERDEWRRAARKVLAFAARQPRPITDAMVEAATIALCCGKECDAANACAGHGLSPGGYADRYGCGSTEKRNDAIAALEAAEAERARGDG